MVGRAENGATGVETSKEGRVYLGLKLDDKNYSLIWSRPNGRRSD